MSDYNVIITTFSIGSALICLILALMGNIFKQNYLRSFSLLYFLLFISNLTLMIYAVYERISILTLSLSLLIVSAYFLHYGAKQLYQLKENTNEWKILISIILIITFLSLFPNTEFINGTLFILGILFYYVSSAVIFYKHGLRREKAISFILIAMLLLMLVRPYLAEYEKTSVWLTLIQGYFGLVLAIYLIFIHLSRVEIRYKQQQNDLQYLSFHDPLTGVYNRTYLNQLIEDKTLGNNCPVVVIMMDMNNLKNINDTYGHDAGDQAISYFAAEINAIKGQDDLIIRRSGDEFLLFMLNTEELQAKDFIEKIIKHINHISIEDIFLSISVGYAIMNDPCQDLSETIHMADQAMYQYKKGIKNKN